MSAPIPTKEQLQRAYAQLRKPNWLSLDALQTAHVHYVAVMGLARNLADRPALFSKPVHQAAPAPQPGASLAAALKRPPVHDGRSAGAGEFVHAEGDD